MTTLKYRTSADHFLNERHTVRNKNKDGGFTQCDNQFYKMSFSEDSKNKIEKKKYKKNIPIIREFDYFHKRISPELANLSPNSFGLNALKKKYPHE